MNRKPLEDTLRTLQRDIAAGEVEAFVVVAAGPDHSHRWYQAGFSHASLGMRVLGAMGLARHEMLGWYANLTEDLTDGPALIELRPSDPSSHEEGEP